jgi:hypothetical protein
MNKLRAKVIGKLRELFQLDQPISISLFRIMHARPRSQCLSGDSLRGL